MIIKKSYGAEKVRKEYKFLLLSLILAIVDQCIKIPFSK